MGTRSGITPHAGPPSARECPVSTPADAGPDRWRVLPAARPFVSKRDSEVPDNDKQLIAEKLDELIRLLGRAVPPETKPPDFVAADAFVWHPERSLLQPVERVNRVTLNLLKGIDRLRDLLMENTERFARGLPANNVLLWGARGMGKSSL
ncbi:MAG: DUF815 domain-containing protein, partial [bacterium]|nr:DUF815 domain-containing protein [bacterium]